MKKFSKIIALSMAGLMAASRALSMGKKVVVLEKNGYIGGATTLNGSNVVGTGSKVSAAIIGIRTNNISIKAGENKTIFFIH